jgi:hypothetical protein
MEDVASSYQADVGATMPSGGRSTPYALGKEIAKDSGVHGAMARTRGKKVDSYKGYTYGNGKSVGSVKEYDGKIFLLVERCQEM